MEKSYAVCVSVRGSLRENFWQHLWYWIKQHQWVTGPWSSVVLNRLEVYRYRFGPCQLKSSTNYSAPVMSGNGPGDFPVGILVAAILQPNFAKQNATKWTKVIVPVGLHSREWSRAHVIYCCRERFCVVQWKDIGKRECMLSETWGKLLIFGVSSLLKLVSQQHSEDNASLCFTLWLLGKTFGPQTVSLSLDDTLLNCAPALLPRHSSKTRQLVFMMMKSNHCSEWKRRSVSNAVPVFIAFTSCCHFLSCWGAGRLDARSCQHQILGENAFLTPFYFPQLYIVLAGQEVGRQLAWPVPARFWRRGSGASCFRAVRLALFTTKCSSKLKLNENGNFASELDHAILFRPFTCSVARERNHSLGKSIHGVIDMGDIRASLCIFMHEIITVAVLKVSISVVPQAFGSKIANPRNGVRSREIQFSPSDSFESLSQRVQKWLFVILLNCLLWQLA